MTSTEPPEREPGDREGDVRALIEDARADADLMGVTADLQRVCRAVTEALALRGAAVHVMTRGGTDGVAATSDAEARVVAELPFASGEGPALAAFLSQRPVLVPALDDVVARWPGFATSALDLGVRAVFAFPLQEGAAALGVLEVYADSAGSLGPDALALTAGFARAATGLLLDGGLLTPAGDLQAGVALSLVDRARIYQAQGMVMVDLQTSLVDALTRMRARAFASGTTLLEVADQVIAGTLTAESWLEGDAAPGGSLS